MINTYIFFYICYTYFIYNFPKIKKIFVKNTPTSPMYPEYYLHYKAKRPLPKNILFLYKLNL